MSRTNLKSNWARNFQPDERVVSEEFTKQLENEIEELKRVLGNTTHSLITANKLTVLYDGHEGIYRGVIADASTLLKIYD